MVYTWGGFPCRGIWYVDVPLTSGIAPASASQQADYHRNPPSLKSCDLSPHGQAHRTPCPAPKRRGRPPKATPIPVPEEEEADEGDCGDAEEDAAEDTGKLCGKKARQNQKVSDFTSIAYDQQ